jgi:hypothetical protein
MSVPEQINHENHHQPPPTTTHAPLKCLQLLLIPMPRHRNPSTFTPRHLKISFVRRNLPFLAVEAANDVPPVQHASLLIYWRGGVLRQLNWQAKFIGLCHFCSSNLFIFLRHHITHMYTAASTSTKLRQATLHPSSGREGGDWRRGQDKTAITSRQND